MVSARGSAGEASDREDGGRTQPQPRSPPKPLRRGPALRPLDRTLATLRGRIQSPSSANNPERRTGTPSWPPSGLEVCATTAERTPPTPPTKNWGSLLRRERHPPRKRPPPRARPSAELARRVGRIRELASTTGARRDRLEADLSSSLGSARARRRKKMSTLPLCNARRERHPGDRSLAPRQQHRRLSRVPTKTTQRMRRCVGRCVGGFRARNRSD
mmetsp:Transcript_6867/g.25651  ORF Transcript_6867/g.25651 Transcript_6867/m.25651 type:complete len:216 (-) Transcript_6867:178-825(-)